ncbi:thioesterase family protein [Schumannella luteola]|uniref:Acyl-CoA thioester hydrolase n=1 Tax=Schumannella luteola TaxID=472059 RepID=A0A852YH29_9MICO|nr:thioesterase family protein [Schumannella luteola]NYH00452.1 acyl-CoA thioester hydrolase [Schumannella luteola]TPX03638.1 acyl-CoA thioesterase [Schumannella luteola]
MTRLHVPIRLRWNDLDAYGHVNNAAMLVLLEEARIQAFWATDAAGAESAVGGTTAILDGSPGAATMTLIGRQEVEYLAPIPYLRRPLDVQLWLGHLGGASLEVCYEVRSPEGDEPLLYAKAATTIVLVDATSGRPRRITDAEREAWAPYLEAPIEFRRR